MLRLPVDRERRVRLRVHVVDLEIGEPGDAQWRLADAQALLHLRGDDLRDLVVRQPTEHVRANLEPDQHQRLALPERAILLVFGVSERDQRDVADHDAAEHHLRADLETLHRFVEVALHHDLLAKQGARSQHEHQGDGRCQREQDEHAEAEIGQLLIHWHWTAPFPDAGLTSPPRRPVGD